MGDDTMLIERMRWFLADMSKTLDMLAGENGYPAGYLDPVRPAVLEAFGRVLTAWGAEGQDWQRHGRLFFLRTLDSMTLAAAIYRYARAGAKKALGEPLSPEDQQLVDRQKSLNKRIEKYLQEQSIVPAGTVSVRGALLFAFEVFSSRDANEEESLRKHLAMPPTSLEINLPGALVEALSWQKAEGSILQPLARGDAEMAIAVWDAGEGRGAGRPARTEAELPPRWEFLAQLCSALGLGVIAPDSLRKDWEKAVS